MRGSLHRHAAITSVEHLAKRPLEVDRLRGRPRDRAPLPAHAALHGAEQPWTHAGGGKDGEEQERGRRLAVRPGHARDAKLASRAPEERIGGERHRLAGVRDDQLRNGHSELALDDQRSGSPVHGFGGEVVAVRLLARDARKQSPSRHAARVVREVGDVCGAGVDRARRAHGVAQALQLDGGGFYQRDLPLPRTL